MALDEACDRVFGTEIIDDSFDLEDIPVPFHAIMPRALREYVCEVRKLSQIAASQTYDAAYYD